MVLKINGVDMLPFIQQKGIKWSRQDIDGKNAGRTLDGEMQRERVATKIRLDITCLPLSTRDANIVLNAIYPELVDVEYEDPMYGLTYATMYSNNIPATYIDTQTDLWEGIAFPLIQK